VSDKLAAIARYVGLEKPTLDGLLAWVLELRRAIGIPHTLAELGIGRDRLDLLAEMAAVDPTAGGNPVEKSVVS
jgi:alcohol dehydrogenase class IV